MLGIDHSRVSTGTDIEGVEGNTAIKVDEEEGEESAEVDDTETVTVEAPVSVHEKDGEELSVEVIDKLGTELESVKDGFVVVSGTQLEGVHQEDWDEDVDDSELEAADIMN
jgi:hypothetical protein